MENRKLYLLAYYFEAVSNEPNCPYPPLEVNIVIEKDEVSSKFHFIDFGIEDSHWRRETVFETFEDALDHFCKYQIAFYFFEIQELDISKKFLYTKKLIDKLNTNQQKSIENLPIESFKKHLGIELSVVNAASANGIRIINLTKNKGSNVEKSFFVGKISVEGSAVIVKDEHDCITFLTSIENLTIETQEIKEGCYWYFKK